MGRLDGPGLLECAERGLPVIPDRGLLGLGEAPVAVQRAFERRDLRPKLPGVLMPRPPAVRLGGGLFRLLRMLPLDRLPALGNHPLECPFPHLPLDRPGAPSRAGVVGVELDDAPQRRSFLAELSGATGVLGLPALGQQLRESRDARFPCLRLGRAGPPFQGLRDVHPGGLRVPGGVVVLRRPETEPVTGFLFPGDVIGLPLRGGQEPERRTGVAVAVRFESFCLAERDPFQRRPVFGQGRSCGRGGLQRVFETA